jgi:L-asparaginase II
MNDPAEPSPPVAVVVRRGGTIESVHRASFAVCDHTGRLIHGSGELTRATFPRSAVKPIQALPLVESGAAERFGLADEEVALASASHAGEPDHVQRVRRWLERIDLSVTDLACGAHLPFAEPAARVLLRAGEPPSPLHHNCSGKHAAMLTLARHLGAPTLGYLEQGHPVQQLIARTLAQMTGVPELPAPGIDGCGVPTWPLPLPALATAMARLGRPQGLSEARAHACLRIARAMRNHPALVAGEGRACTVILRALPGVIVKTGAEGIYAAALPAEGLGIALKIEDGAGRASVFALLGLLEVLGVFASSERPDLEHLLRPRIRNQGGFEVGSIEIGSGWPPLRCVDHLTP